MTEGPLQETISSCPECKTSHVVKDYNRGEVVCGDCGLVIHDHLIDPGPEWRAYDSNESRKKARAGTTYRFSLDGKEMTTEIGRQNKDSSGRQIPVKNRAQVNRMRLIQQRIRYSRAASRSFNEALALLEKLASKMGLPGSVKDEAAFIYRRAARKALTRGRSIEIIAVTSLYASCRQRSLPRSLNEIADVSGVKRKDIGRSYKLLLKHLKIKTSVSTPQNYIRRFCNELMLSAPTQKKAMEVLDRAADKKLVISRHPICIAAATTYLAAVLCKEWRTQKEVAKVSGVTEITIRKRYKEIAETTGLELQLG